MEKSTTAEYLKEKGYKEYKPTSFHHENVARCYQKRFDDEIGKRYFITANEYSSWTHPYTGNVFPQTFEFEIQMHQKDTHKPINMLFFAGWEIDEVEEHAKKIFETGLYDYYEFFE